MINVVEAISDVNIGGAGILLLNRLKNSDRALFDTVVVLPHQSLLKERFEKLGVKTYGIKHGGDRSFSLRGLYGYYKALKCLKPDVINSHGSLNSRFAAWFVGVPARIYTRHCVYPVSKLYKLLPVRYITGAVTERLSHGIIAVAHSAKKNLTDMGIKKDKIRVIINGAEPLKAINLNEREILKNSLGIEKDDIVVSIFARLEPCKDHKSFLKAAALLTHSSTNYKFLILGSGSIEHELKQYARRLRVDKNVRFLGFVDDIAPFMNITDINVNCSIGTETSSLALSEGMSLGVPAVVSDYGGNPYMVSEGENGYVYPQGDYGSLAMLIKRIAKMKGSEEYKSLSSGAYERYKNELNAKSMTEKTEEFYKELYKRKKPRR